MYQKIVTLGLNASAWLLFALALAMPSGYSYGALGLVIFSVAGWGRLRRHHITQAGGVALTAIVVSMGLLWGLSFDGWWSWTGSDYWPKYWFAAACFAGVAQSGISSRWVQWGIAAGGLSALGVAAYQYLVQGWPKATGFTNAIQYGGIAMYLGLAAWCLALFGGRPWRQALWFWLAGICGVLASLLSETRGAWVVAPLLLLSMLWTLFRHGQARLALGSLIAACVLVLAAVVPYGQKFYDRGNLAVVEMQHYLAHPQQSAETSIGQRLEQWRLAWHLAAERPLTGWGTQGVIQAKQVMVERGLAHPSVMQYGHAHNEILDMLVKRGLLGVLLLLLFYAIPLILFWPTRARLARVPTALQGQALALRMAAGLLPIAYFGFGWTQVFFAHNSGNMFYIFALVAFFGALQGLAAEGKSAAVSPSPAHSQS